MNGIGGLTGMKLKEEQHLVVEPQWPYGHVLTAVLLNDRPTIMARPLCETCRKRVADIKTHSSNETGEEWHRYCSRCRPGPSLDFF